MTKRWISFFFTHVGLVMKFHKCWIELIIYLSIQCILLYVSLNSHTNIHPTLLQFFNLFLLVSKVILFAYSLGSILFTRVK